MTRATHNFLTLDLVGKGLRYPEVPISYRRRGQGSSFVALVATFAESCPPWGDGQDSLAACGTREVT